MRVTSLRVWNRARHFGGQLDRHIESAARLYGDVVQPILRAVGNDTSRADAILGKGYSDYKRIRDGMREGVAASDRFAYHLSRG